MTDRDELRAAYGRLREFIDANAATHTEQRAILADLALLGAALASVLGPEAKPEQAALIDVPKRRIYR